MVADTVEGCAHSCAVDIPCTGEIAYWGVTSYIRSPAAVSKEAWAAAHEASQEGGGSF
jgi:hypothetical protein